MRTLEHPKYAVELAMQDVDDQLAECRTGRGEAIVRLRPAIVFESDGPAFVDGIELREHEGLNEDECECLRQTLASMEIPRARLDPSLALPWRFTPTIDLIFDERGEMIRQVVPRGPMKHLATRTDDGADVRDAVAACGGAGSIRAKLTFEPFTRRLQDVEPEAAAPRVQQCVVEAVHQAVIKGVPF
jgi:hypothetical protein